MTWVFLIHLLEFLSSQAPKGSLDSQAITFVYPIGTLAGKFFVIITGCFLYRSLLAAPAKYTTFLRRRLVRIYSVFSVVLALYLALSMVFPSESRLPHNPLNAAIYVLENFLLLPGVLQITPIISVSWTLSYIVLYCLILPPMIGLTGMRRWQASQRVLFFLSVTVLCILGANWTHAYPEALAFLPIGAIAWEALAWRKRNPTTARWAESAAVAVAILSLGCKYWLVYHDGVSIFACSAGGKQFTTSTLYLFSLCFALFSENSIARQALCWTPLRWLGNISYSYYLTHGLFINLLTLFTPAVAVIVRSPAGFWTTVALTYLISLLPAAGLYLLVERRSTKISAAPASAKVPEPLAVAA